MNTNDKNAILSVEKRFNAVDIGWSYRVVLDGKRIGTIPSGTGNKYRRYCILPGKHSLYIALGFLGDITRSNTINFEALAGQILNTEFSVFNFLFWTSIDLFKK